MEKPVSQEDANQKEGDGHRIKQACQDEEVDDQIGASTDSQGVGNIRRQVRGQHQQDADQRADQVNDAVGGGCPEQKQVCDQEDQHGGKQNLTEMEVHRMYPIHMSHKMLMIFMSDCPFCME